IDSQGPLVGGKEAEVKGNISGEHFRVSGKIEGEVKVANRAVFYKGAQFLGNLETSVLVVEEGAKIHGQVSMKTGGKIESPETM
ncbi:MAG TPA: hypothetical protein DIT19_01005, partial [Desulfonauticus sp.]|nr:hypothetical protein [Desulfonauticus sp.]